LLLAFLRLYRLQPLYLLGGNMEAKMKDYKILKARAKDYDRGGRFDTNPIENFYEIHQWLRDNQQWVWESRLHGDNRKALRDVFGKPSFCWRGSFYFHCWVVDLGEAQVLVLTAREKGTCYELIVSRDGEKIRKDKQAVIDFLKWLSESLVLVKEVNDEIQRQGN
jgi:hypothetical protein